MNRRSFFRLIAGATATPLIPKPLLALAAPIEASIPPFDGLYYFSVPYTTGDYLGISRLSTPHYVDSPLTMEVVRRCVKHWERYYA